MKNIIVVAAIIWNKDCILISQRDGGFLSGLWEFPGGKIESGETHEETIIREIDEELSIKIDVEKYFMTVNHKYETFNLTMHTYFSNYISGEIELKDHSDAKWVTYDELLNYTYAPADVPIVEKLIELNKK